MKKVIAVLLVLVMILGLCACSGNKYAKYDYIDEMLDNGDYEGAVMAIYDLWLEEQGTEENGGEDPQPVNEPTQEEKDMMWQYYSMVRNLNSYLEDGYISAYDQETETSYFGSGALEYYYNRLSGMEAIDKWVGTEYISSDRFSEEINWDRNAVLEDFTILKDVKLSQTYTSTDNMGNVNTSNETPWTYDENGVLIYQGYEYYVDRIAYSNYYGNYQLEYDESGRLIQKKYGSGDYVSALETFSYDAAGCLTNIHLKTNSGEYDYACTCDDQGRLIQIAWNDYYDFTITYTYDNAGRLVKEEKTEYYHVFGDEENDSYIYETWTMEYVYDGNNLTTGTYTEQDWSYQSKNVDGKLIVTENYPLREQQNRYDYTCDSQGRVICCSVTMGNGVYVHSNSTYNEGDVYSTPSYTNKTIETFYGDYYLYSPKN